MLIARTAYDGLCIAYFMTGRSPASRERVLVRDGEALYARPRTATAHDPLRHYRAVTVGPKWCVVGNGDQVDTVTRRLVDQPPTAAVQDIAYEPDPPLRTPRITAVAPRGDGPILLASSRASILAPEQTFVSTVSVDDLPVGCGLLNTTYFSIDRQVASTNHSPLEVQVAVASAAELLSAVWSALPPDLRVAAAVVAPRATDPIATRVSP